MYEKLKMLSYSSIELLRTCPRKYQLTKLSEVSPRDSTIHTAFGSSLGAGIQSLLSNNSMDTALFAAFAAWHIDLDECDAKTDKSFTSVHNALLQFKSTQYPTISQEYELLTLPNGLPAIELSASIELPDGFKYRLYIDAVLRRKSDGMLTVLELKTTGSSWVNASSYKNSGQALGYSVVLDALAKELNTSSNYRVIYLVYKSKGKEFERFDFIKTVKDKLNWIDDMITEVRILKLYDKRANYPMHGSKCQAFNRDCNFFGLCNMENSALFDSAIANESPVEPVYNYYISLDSLLEVMQNATN